jgi:hypothetical protein
MDGSSGRSPPLVGGMSGKVCEAEFTEKEKLKDKIIWGVSF